MLALLLVAGALTVHARGQASARWVVPVLLLLAHLSKSMSVAAVGLLAAQDLLLRRRPDWRLYLGVALAAAVALAVHLHVGRAVGMTGEPAGGSRITAAMTMGPVWLRYLGVLVWPGQLSLVQDVVVRTHWDAPSVAGYAVLLLWGEGDPFGVQVAQATQDALVNAEVEFVLLEGCGHFWHECPDQVYSRVRAFLDQVGQT